MKECYLVNDYEDGLICDTYHKQGEQCILDYKERLGKTKKQ